MPPAFISPANSLIHIATSLCVLCPLSARQSDWPDETEVADIPRPVSFAPATFSQSCVASATTSSRNRSHAATSLHRTRYFVVSTDCFSTRQPLLVKVRRDQSLTCNSFQPSPSLLAPASSSPTRSATTPVSNSPATGLRCTASHLQARLWPLSDQPTTVS